MVSERVVPSWQRPRLTTPGGPATAATAAESELCTRWGADMYEVCIGCETCYIVSRGDWQHWFHTWFFTLPHCTDHDHCLVKAVKIAMSIILRCCHSDMSPGPAFIQWTSLMSGP